MTFCTRKLHSASYEKKSMSPLSLLSRSFLTQMTSYT